MEKCAYHGVDQIRRQNDSIIFKLESRKILFANIARSLTYLFVFPRENRRCFALTEQSCSIPSSRRIFVVSIRNFARFSTCFAKNN